MRRRCQAVMFAHRATASRTSNHELRLITLDYEWAQTIDFEYFEYFELEN